MLFICCLITHHSKQWTNLWTQLHIHGNVERYSPPQACSMPLTKPVTESSITLTQKTTDTYMLGNRKKNYTWFPNPKTQLCQRTKLHLMLVLPNGLETELISMDSVLSFIHNSWLGNILGKTGRSGSRAAHSLALVNMKWESLKA